MPSHGTLLRRRNVFRRIELGLSLLLLASLAVIALSISALLNESALFIVFVVPGFLAMVALIRSSLDVYVITRKEWDLMGNVSRWVLLGKLIVLGVIGLFGLATLFIVVQTILVVTFYDTGGGVIFGQFLWMVTGAVLAVVILLQAAIEIFLMDDNHTLPGRTLPFQDES